jgi:hypothetical protein
MKPSESPTVFRFGDFELDVGAYELRLRGKPVRLERRPMDLMILLVERRNQLVSRDDIVGRLWGDGVFVDVETGVNTAIRKAAASVKRFDGGAEIHRDRFWKGLPLCGRGHDREIKSRCASAGAGSTPRHAGGITV